MNIDYNAFEGWPIEAGHPSSPSAERSQRVAENSLERSDGASS